MSLPLTESLQMSSDILTWFKDNFFEIKTSQSLALSKDKSTHEKIQLIPSVLQTLLQSLLLKETQQTIGSLIYSINKDSSVTKTKSQQVRLIQLHFQNVKAMDQ